MGFIGNFLSPVLITRYGKQKTHLVTTIPALVGWSMFVLGESVPVFLIARLMLGVSFGPRIPISPALVAEYTDAKYRGAFTGTFSEVPPPFCLANHVPANHTHRPVSASADSLRRGGSLRTVRGAGRAPSAPTAPPVSSGRWR
ncbi:hypothetical protein EVAR_18087_1 [Eumeta japonica]|uniref:Major facilitator superfamily (MFS) profile domain-containing protein n=1 Tax=Eumeta variegata TaxID=151549 RepID=A0A4C1VGH3_EUMVA|nr:hypothetical protein EVAR_18087_1 [Eumeta japonica]